MAGTRSAQGCTTVCLYCVCVGGDPYWMLWNGLWQTTCIQLSSHLPFPFSPPFPHCPKPPPYLTPTPPPTPPPRVSPSPVLFVRCWPPTTNTCRQHWTGYWQQETTQTWTHPSQYHHQLSSPNTSCSACSSSTCCSRVQREVPLYPNPTASRWVQGLGAKSS